MAYLLVQLLRVEERVAHEQRVAGERGDRDASLRVGKEGREDAGGPGAGGDEEACAWYYVCQLPVWPNLGETYSLASAFLDSSRSSLRSTLPSHPATPPSQSPDAQS